MGGVTGRLPRSQLSPIAGGWLRRDAAAAWNAMNHESQRRFGVTLRPGGPISSYRNYAQQVAIRAQKCAQGRCQDAAIPGRSNHGRGISVDVADPRFRNVIAKIGARYGWAKRWSDAPWEPWHFTYRQGIWKGKNPGLADRWPILKNGDRGPGVRRLKKLLRDRGVELPDNDVFGDGAEKAVRRFQAQAGMTADGVVGPATWKRLRGGAKKVAKPVRGAPPMLRLGARGAWVTRLQRLLGRAGMPVKQDGVFGPGTNSAVQAFQANQKLTPDGVVGAQTWAALRRAKAATDGKPQPAPTPTPTPTPAPTPHHGGRPTHMSARGIEFIASFEGFRGRLYNDPAAGHHCTIGFGHLVHHGPCNGSEPKEFRRGITREQALALLRRDVASAASAVRRYINVPLRQNEFDALSSFAFNLGGGALRDSTLRRKLNAGDHGAVPGQLLRWVHAGGGPIAGLVRRRRAEGQLFTHGKY
jgi:lysozyme